MQDFSKETKQSFSTKKEQEFAEGLQIPSFDLKIKNISDFKNKIESSLAENVTEFLKIIFAGAIYLDASDIHFEPKEEKTKMRLRVDGVLQDLIFFEEKLYQTILSRIKLISGLKLNVNDRPQDGRFSLLTKDGVIEIRTSILPSEYGEAIVLRVLNPKSLIDMEKLGLRDDIFELFKKEIKRPNGMIIVTGPTGSGKTTTLYAFLKKIHRSEIKIITIEDPIEYHLKEASQTQVDPKKGYDFASGLKSIMRQDPDVILVGEIRDIETAEIAIQAALTGHLVLTTLHTNDAAGTLTRLINLGAKPIDVSAALNIAAAQRLVRKVCQECKKLKTINDQELSKIKKAIKGINKIKSIPALNSQTKIPEAKGCKKCNFTGYKGRVGLFEVMFFDNDIRKFILENPSVTALKEKMLKKGMTTIYQDGIIKVLQELTTLEEVERVAEE